METITLEEYHRLTQKQPKRRKAKAKRPRSKAFKVECGVCHTAIKYPTTSGRGPSWGMVKIGGQLVSVHQACYYAKQEAA